MTIITRFAPSPTGHLHVGNLRTALHNWMFARSKGGKFLLRIDDTDSARSDERFVEAVRADLDWLGMKPDGEARQSDRFDRYDARFAELVASGRVYSCYETPEELALKRKVQLSRGLPPVYDRAALKLTDADRAKLEAGGVAPHWRFRLDPETAIDWDDLVRGHQHFDAASLSDPVIRRGDGSWLYLLPSVIDDIDMNITHVVRGEDHVSNTAAQVQMFSALGAKPPIFAHAALLTGSEGKLSKRLGSLGIDHFRDIGIEPQALISLLSRIGTSQPVEPVVDPQPLIDAFDFAHFGRAPARFDEVELAQVNARIVHQLPYTRVVRRLPKGMNGMAWNTVKANLSTLNEAAEWWAIIAGPFTPPAAEEADHALLDAAALEAAVTDWLADPWHQITNNLKELTGRKGKALFLPLRRALTGRDAGPDMAALLPLIGREATIERLKHR